jgi:pimeloyl-ACP methyl ester carboxylesterase
MSLSNTAGCSVYPHRSPEIVELQAEARLKDAGHGLPFEQPERLGELVISFLQSWPSCGSCASVD